MQYFKIIAQDGHVFWLNETIILDQALGVGTKEDGSAEIFLQHSDELFTSLAEYPTEDRAYAVLMELEEAYRYWNLGYSKMCKWFPAKNFYVLPEEAC